VAGDELRAALRGTQADLWLPDTPQPTLRQTGGLVLPELFDLPLCVPGDPVDPGWQAEPQIETFTVSRPEGIADDRTGPQRCEAMTEGRGAVWWQASVERFVAAVQVALDLFGVVLAGPATVTASITPIDEVNAEPHLDDSMYRPADGVGVVAIAATGAGPRALVGALPRPDRHSLAELGLEVDHGFASASDPTTESPQTPDDGPVIEHYPANRITLFTRFGQVHAGPSPAALSGHDAYPLRSLLVYRAGTVPQLTGAASDVAGPRAGSGPT
jgi:hypothetical protein